MLGAALFIVNNIWFVLRALLQVLAEMTLEKDLTSRQVTYDSHRAGKQSPSYTFVEILCPTFVQVFAGRESQEQEFLSQAPSSSIQSIQRTQE